MLARSLPKVGELFATLTGGKTLDLQQAYLQLHLEETSKVFTTINAHRGLFQFSRLPFRALSAPGIFQRAMNSLLQGIALVDVYMDDILVSEQQHLETLALVLRRLE